MPGRRTRHYDQDLRDRARALRQAGLTYTEIRETLGVDIPQSTLNNWVKHIELTAKHRARIRQMMHDSAIRTQSRASQWSKDQKQLRLREIAEKAAPIAERLAHDREALMLMASALYMGEGAKNEKQFSIGNSDAQIVQVWLVILRRVFEIDEAKLRCQLALSADMDEAALKRYWSRITRIPISRFIRSSIKKTGGSRKREGYKGVCIIYYYSLAVRRFLDAIGQGVTRELLNLKSGL